MSNPHNKKDMVKEAIEKSTKVDRTKEFEAFLVEKFPRVTRPAIAEGQRALVEFDFKVKSGLYERSSQKDGNFSEHYHIADVGRFKTGYQRKGSDVTLSYKATFSPLDDALNEHSKTFLENIKKS